MASTRKRQGSAGFVDAAGPPGLRVLHRQGAGGVDRYCDEVTAVGGAAITRQGTPGREAFIILDGEAEVLVDGTVVAVLGPGDLVGETAMHTSSAELSPARAGADRGARRPTPRRRPPLGSTDH